VKQQILLGGPETERPPALPIDGRIAGRVLLATGILYLIGSLVDLGTLWGLQRQPGPNWEFVAIGSTLDAIPRFGLAFALVAAGLVACAYRGMALYRACGVALLLFGVAAAGLAGMLVTDYFAVVSNGIPEQAVAMVRSTTIKGTLIGGLSFVLYVGVGFLSLRRPAGSR
jgi:hypothetical protein